MKKFILPILFLMVSVLSSCETTEEVKLIDLTVTVKNSNGGTVSGASVAVFNTINKATVETKNSDSAEKANFKLSGGALDSALAIEGSLAGSINITNVMNEGSAYTIDVTNR